MKIYRTKINDNGTFGEIYQGDVDQETIDKFKWDKVNVWHFKNDYGISNFVVSDNLNKLLDFCTGWNEALSWKLKKDKDDSNHTNGR